MLEIRAAIEADGPAVYELAAAFGTSFRVERSAFAACFESLRQDDDCFLAVADASGEVQGYVMAFAHPTFFASGPVCWVEELMVNEHRRRSGIGRALMDAAETWASSREAKLVALATRRAAAFYRALGYDESATYLRKFLEAE